MQTPETRLINQCTYTPIVNSPDVGDDIPGFVPKQPFQKADFLAIVFDDPQRSRFLFDHLPYVDERMKSAVEEMWKGHFASVAEIVNEIGIDELINVARSALEVERTFLQDARRDIEEAVSWVINEQHTASVVTEAGQILQEAEKVIASAVEDEAEVVIELHRVFEDATETIASIVAEQGTGAHTVTEVLKTIAAAEETIVSIVEEQGLGPDVVAQISREMNTLQESVTDVVGRAAITYAKVTTKLAEDYPQSAGFISALGLPMVPMYSPRTLATNESAYYAAEYGAAGTTAEIYEGYQGWYAKETEVAQGYEMYLDFQEYQNWKKEQALKAALETMKVEPVGYLHLERLQFTPVGYERGELVYTLPLLPGETIRLSYREWSRTETEYIKLVATSLETATEDALSEKSELSQSFKTEQQHSSALNASVSTSADLGPIKISTSVGYNSQNSESRSREYAAKHSREITKKASSRAKQEHKISFRVTTEYEVEEESYREISNPLDRAVRWDFHRLMKKWRIDLYRYDVRLTYDIVLPEPGSYLLRKYIQLKLLNDALAKPNPFNLSPADITLDPDRLPDRLNELMRIYGVSLDPPPDEYVYTAVHEEQTFSNQRIVGVGYLDIMLPEGYEFCVWNATGSAVTANGDKPKTAGKIDTRLSFNTNQLNSGAKKGNHYVWQYVYDWAEEITAEPGSVLSISVWVTGKLTDQALKEWQVQCFERLADVAKARYESKQQRLRRLRDDLLAELGREDALMLRKIEKEEIMKGVLRWVLGPTFRFYPSDLPRLSLNESGQLEYYAEGGQGIISDEDVVYEPILKHGEIIRFLHHAIEWENVNYVLYPYFWTDDTRWDFKQFLYHDDYVHRSFLRAGAARVVLTIRPGYEKAFLSFMETGKLGELLPEGEAYMTIADELKAMAQTSYPYTPSAAEEDPKNLVDTWYEFTPTGALDVVEGTIISHHRTYAVQPGDTLGEIAAKFGVTMEAIVEANNIEDPDLIFPGQVLVIPSPGGE